MRDPREIIEHQPMSRQQWYVFALMLGVNALDGFDVLSISFAAPGISDSWGINRAALGVVLSMELIGMAIGAMILGSAADRFGRRPVILTCLVLMSIGMFGASTSTDVVTLSAWRVLTGLGIGGSLATTTATIAEMTNAKRRSLCLVLAGLGYPLGATLGGSVAAILLSQNEWQSVFQFGTVLTLCFIPLVWWLVPESISFRMARPSASALASVNRSLKVLGHAPIDALPPATEESKCLPMSALLKPPFLSATVLMAIAYFAHIVTFYFILKWVPKIVVDMGYPASEAAGVLVAANVGGLVGVLVLGVGTFGLNLKKLTMIALFGSSCLVAFFGAGQETLGRLAAVAALVGFCTNAAVTGLYGLLAQTFPADVRTTAAGFITGLGRGGSALAPALAGLLFTFGWGLQAVALAMGAGSLIALLALARLSPPGQPATAPA